MSMLMMRIRKMSVVVGHRFMDVKMAVPGSRRRLFLMQVSVMLVMKVIMLVFQAPMRVEVGVLFAQM